MQANSKRSFPTCNTTAGKQAARAKMPWMPRKESEICNGDVGTLQHSKKGQQTPRLNTVFANSKSDDIVIGVSVNCLRVSLFP